MSKRRIWGTAVPLPGGTGGSTKIMALGGSTFDEALPSNATTEVYDEAQPGLGWQTDSVDEHRPRPRQHRAAARRLDGRGRRRRGAATTRYRVALAPTRPTEEQKQVELWDPATGHGGSGPRRPRAAPTTPPRCCCPTAA